MSFEQNEAALSRAVDAWNSGDVDSYLDLYDERIKLHAVTFEFPDKSSVAEMYRGFFAATSDLVLTIDEAFGDGDRLCARYSHRETYRGVDGNPSDGSRYLDHRHHRHAFRQRQGARAVGYR